MRTVTFDAIDKADIRAAWVAHTRQSQSATPAAAHADTAAGQSLHYREGDFHDTLRPCSMRLDGVGGSAHIMAQGTIYALLTARGQTTTTHLGVIHNVLHAPTVTATTLFSVSQLQARKGVSFRLDSNESPFLHLSPPCGESAFDLHLCSGLFVLPHVPVMDLLSVCGQQQY